MGNVKPIYGNDARKGLFEGITMLNNAVKITLGPRGRNVIFRKAYLGIHPTKDGVTVAEEINFKDELHNMGANLVKEASSKTNQDAGDGTTTATILAWAIIQKGLQRLENVNVVEVKRGMDDAVAEVVKELEKMSIPVEGNIEMIRNVATISANNDKELGAIIADALKKIGIDGTIKVEESHTNDTYMDVIQGMQFDRGYGSPYFVTDTDTMQIVYDAGCTLVISKDKLTEFTDIERIVEYSIKEDEPVIIIADDFTNEILAHLVNAKLRKNCKVFVVKSPYFGVKREEYLTDIAILSGAKVMSKEMNSPFSSIAYDDFGKVEQCVVTKDSTLMMNGIGSDAVVNAHIDMLKKKAVDTPFEKERLEERISSLRSGIGVLNVGAGSESEVKEKRDRVDDALNATKAAIQEGIIPGGGISLLRISHAMKSSLKGDRSIGYKIIKDAIKVPFIQILLNGGKTDSEIKLISDTIVISQNIGTWGYDSSKDDYVDMIAAGIIDPKKVTRVALENAVSVAGMVLTTDCVLIDEDIQSQEANMPAFLK